MKTEKILTAVLVMQVLTLAGQWAGPVGAARVAQAELPNPAERQLELLQESRQTNAKLDKLLTLLESGDVKVRVVKGEDVPK